MGFGGSRRRGVGLGSERGRLRPISTLANFDFGQFLDVEFWPRYKRRKGKNRRKTEKKKVGQSVKFMFGGL